MIDIYKKDGYPSFLRKKKCRNNSRMMWLWGISDEVFARHYKIKRYW